MATLNIDLSNIESTGFSSEPLPAGNYPCVAVASQLKSTKAGNGRYLEVEFDVIDGPHKGRKLWSRFNIENPSEKAVQIGYEQLAQFGRAVGVTVIQESEQLHGKPVTVKVTVKHSSEYGPSNEVKGFAAMGGPSPAAAGVASPSPSPAPAAAAAGSAPPWAR